MKTTELIEFLKTQKFTDDQAYNLIVSDIYEFVPESQVAKSQEVIAYFMCKIQDVCLPVIRALQPTSEV